MYTSTSSVNEVCEYDFTKEEIVEVIKELKRRGESIHARDLRKKEYRFYRDAIRYFGSWERLISEAGIKWVEEYGKEPYGYWTKERIKNKLDQLTKEGKGVNFRKLVESFDGRGMYEAMVYLYGSWEEALKCNGYHPEECKEVKSREYWTKERIEAEVKLLYNIGEGLQPTSLRKYNANMVKVALEYYGGWEGFYSHFGIDYGEYTKKRFHRDWTEEVVIKELKKRKAEGKSLKATDVHSEDIQLYRNGLKFFGGWKKVMVNLNKSLEEDLA